MSAALRLRTIVVALVAGVALADASIVTLALPELLVELDTGVEGVAAVLGVYTGVLAFALVPAWWIVRARGPELVGAVGLVVFALAAIACGVAGSLAALLVGRAVSAVGAAAGLVAAFSLMTRGASEPLGRRLWLLAAVVGTATGPALGGALTQAFDWRAIFLVQAPIASADLGAATERARLRGVALVLDADLPARRKLELAPELLAGVEAQDPRAGLERTLAEQRPRFTGEQRFVFDRLARRADETLVLAIGEAFTRVLLITGGLALLAALLLLPRARHPARLAAVLATAASVAGGYVLLYGAIAPEPVVIADPCSGGRDLPDSGGVEGLLQKGALVLLDRAACRAGASREELVLALADEDEARRFRERHGVDPSAVGNLLRRALG